MSSGDSEFEDPEKADEEHTYTIVVGEVPEPGTPGTEELTVVQRPHKPYPRLFRNDLIELGSGHFGADQWFLMYDPVGSDPPDEDHLPSGPEVMLYVGSRGGGGPIGGPLSGPLGRSALLVLDLDSPVFASGKVAFGFDRVQLDCATGPAVNALVIDCADHMPFNYYVGEVASRVVRVSATGPDGRMAALEQDQ